MAAEDPAAGVLADFEARRREIANTAEAVAQAELTLTEQHVAQEARIRHEASQLRGAVDAREESLLQMASAMLL